MILRLLPAGLQDRIIALFAGAIVLGCTAALISIGALSTSSAGEDALLRRGLALHGAIAQATANHLKQSASLEHALRDAAPERTQLSAEALERMRIDFESNAAAMWPALQPAQELVANAPEGLDSLVTSDLEGRIDRAGAAHDRYADGVRGVFANIDAGDWDAARAAARALDEPAGEFETSLSRALAALSASGEETVARIEASRGRAVAWVALLTLGAVLVAIAVVARTIRMVAELRALNGLVPICAGCKKIRDDQGYWNQLEAYVEAHSEALFAHSLCGGCVEATKRATRPSVSTVSH